MIVHICARPQRQYWSMTTMLLISLVACYVLQLLLENQLGKKRVDELFALSIAGLKEGWYYQLITFQFMHVGLLHIAGNMFGLYFFGRAMEEALGRKGMLWLYLMSGTIGGLVQVALGLAFPSFGNATVLGASAGVFGLIAAFAPCEPNYPITLLVFFVLPVTMRAKWLLLIEAVLVRRRSFHGRKHGAWGASGRDADGHCLDQVGGLVGEPGGIVGAGNAPARRRASGRARRAARRPAAAEERGGIAAGGVHQPGGGSDSGKDFRPRHSQPDRAGTRDSGGRAEQNGAAVRISFYDTALFAGGNAGDLDGAAQAGNLAANRIAGRRGPGRRGRGSAKGFRGDESRGRVPDGALQGAGTHAQPRRHRLHHQRGGKHRRAGQPLAAFRADQQRYY